MIVLNNDMNTVTVYGLRASDDGRIRYVGQTRKSLAFRLKYHLVGAKRWGNRHVSKWINATLKRGAHIEIFTLEENAVENEAEIRLIKWNRENGARLVNGTDGGEGCRGFSPTAETRQRLRAANLGKRQSPETVQKRADAIRGMKRPKEVGEKIAAAHRGKKCPWVTERNNDPVFREKARLARIARWAVTPKRGPSLEARTTQAEKIRGTKRSPETRKRMSLAKEKWWRERKSLGLE